MASLSILNQIKFSVLHQLILYKQQLIKFSIKYYMSWSRKNKANGNDLVSKTQIALEAIKKYQARSFRLFEKNRYNLNNPLNVFRQIDDQYTKLHFHKQLKLDKSISLHIMPYNEEYFYISTDLLIFPVRIIIKNVKNEGTLYVGYDKQYPGVEKMKDQYDRETKSYQSQKKVYDYKFNFNKDVMCVLKNEKKKTIRKIFLSLMAKKQFLICNLKYDYIGYQSMQNEEQKNRPKRSLTEGNANYTKGNFELPSTSPSKKKIGSILNNGDFILNEGLKTIKDQFQLRRSKTENESLQNHLRPMYLQKEQDNQVNEFGQKQENKEKDFIEKNLKNLSLHKRQKSRQLIDHKKQKALKSVERIKANKQQLQEYKEKERLIKEAASKLKKSIEHFQKIYKEQRVRNFKIINSLAPMVYLTIFMNKSNTVYNKQTQSVTKTFTVRYLIKKFTKALRKKYIDSILQIGNFKNRNQMSCFHAFQLCAKTVLPSNEIRAGGLIFQSFKSLQSALILNHSLNQATNYRQSCRTIQRRWILKYKARLQMLEGFGKRHVEMMLKQYPHLRLAQNLFKNGNHCHKICYQYMVDQSIKFRYIYDAYEKRVREIDQFIEANEKIREFNKGKPENRMRKYLDIPKKPTPPQQRIFRNLDILKSMLRGWFQIEYKKILKKSAYNK